MLLSGVIFFFLFGAAIIFVVCGGQSAHYARALCSLLRHWLALRLISWRGARQRQYLEADTQNICQVQEEILLQRLRKNQDTEYGREHQFNYIQDSGVFRGRHPLTQYVHYSNYILRISEGAENVLLPGRPATLTTTSGSSSTNTMLLGTVAAAKDFFLQGTAICWNAILTSYPGLYGMQKIARFCYTTARHQTEAGLPVGSAPSYSSVKPVYSSPPTVSQITSIPEALYIHLLFALKEQDLGVLEASSAWSICDAFTALHNQWEVLAKDVCIGRVKPELMLSDSIRREVNALLKPDAERAWELRIQFEKGFQGIAKRVWPRLHTIVAVDSGANELDGYNLKELYCQGTPIYSPLYVAAEGLLGVNLWPEKSERHYLLCPRSMFFEFIPLELCEEDQPLTLAMHEVNENELYELVITNNSGLYRYRIGDVVRVARFHNQCPVVEFMYRQSQTLNLRGEKITEKMFYHSLRHAVSLWHGAVLVNYCTADSRILGPDSGGSDLHYEVFVELKGIRNLSEDQRYKLDQCLQEDIPAYKMLRIKGSLGHSRVHLLQLGTFTQLRQFIASSYPGTVYDQLQMPRVLKRKELADFLQRHVIS